MMKRLLIFILWSVSLAANAQGVSSRREEIEVAAKKLDASFTKFDEDVVAQSLSDCIGSLVHAAHGACAQFLVSNFLYNIDTTASFRLSTDAYLADSMCIEFRFTYANQLHRKRRYAEAARLYEQCLKETPGDISYHVWLADCYINTGRVQDAINAWDSAGYNEHHTSIDKAIWAIYGKTSLYHMRDTYRKDLAGGKTASAYPLIMLDMMWEQDWWNFRVNERFLAEDMRLAKEKCTADEYDELAAYVHIKKLPANEGSKDSVKLILEQGHLLIGNGKIPGDGNITSDLLRICIGYELVPEMQFYNLHGEDIRQRAMKENDKDLLNIYAYLQASVYRKVDPAIDRIGWTQLKDERFAISYFVGKAEKNRLNDPELLQSLKDFPESAPLYWIYTNCAKNEQQPMRPYLIELIKREFRTLATDPDKFGNSLNAFVGFLAAEK